MSPDDCSTDTKPTQDFAQLQTQGCLTGMWPVQSEGPCSWFSVLLSPTTLEFLFVLTKGSCVSFGTGLCNLYSQHPPLPPVLSHCAQTLSILAVLKAMSREWALELPKGAVGKKDLTQSVWGEGRLSRTSLTYSHPPSTTSQEIPTQ